MRKVRLMENEIHTKVVGVTFGIRQRIVEQLKIDMDLFLKLEPSNEYDKNAVAVWSKFGQVGYIRRVLAEDISDAMRRGIKYRVKVLDRTGSGNDNKGVNILIWRPEVVTRMCRVCGCTDIKACLGGCY